jgi:hypothetical protein
LIKGEIEIAPMGTPVADARCQVSYSAATVRVLICKIELRELEQIR